MQWRYLATDYDGSLAHDGRVNATTVAAVDRFRAGGGRVLMVTGRELPDLRSVCDVLDRFEWIVAENGALLHRPGDGFTRLVTAGASPQLAQKLAEAGAHPLSVGLAIIATREPYESVAIALIKALGLELQIIFNKGAVMILPTGVNKATGLTAALAEMKLTAAEVVAVGDAENDHALLSISGMAVAVSNAVPTLKEHADLVTNGARGDGVSELIDRMLQDALPPARRSPGRGP
jgi:hydroxymethylpyrimidine pyrophosphatase-like HAD family hydrolase